eukprot:3081047-Pyramimonas_sp.AAC.1
MKAPPPTSIAAARWDLRKSALQAATLHAFSPQRSELRWDSRAESKSQPAAAPEAGVMRRPPKSLKVDPPDGGSV